MRRRALLTTAAAGLSLVAGCATGDGSDSEASRQSSPRREQTTAVSDDPDDPSGIDEMRNTVETDKPITIRNEDDEAHTVTVTVTRDDDGEVVHEDTYELAPGSIRVPYNLQSADPDGVEGFQVVVRMGEESGGLFLRTSACYTAPSVTVVDGGQLRTEYTIC